MVKQATTVGTCCYIGCTKSFLTDKETTFFKFPDDLERRKKWILNCGNAELGSLAERQLRGKRICINHFPASAFTGASGEKNSLKDTAMPIPFKKAGTPTPVQATPSTSTPAKTTVVTPLSKTEENVDEPTATPPAVKRGRGRPPKIKQEVIIKSEPIEAEPEEEIVGTPQGKEKSVATSKEKTAAETPAKEKPNATQDLAKGNVLGTPEETKEKSTGKSSTISKEKTAEGGISAEKPLSTSDAVKRKSVAAPSTPKEKSAAAPGTVKGKLPVGAGTVKDKPAGAPGTPKDKASASPGLTKDSSPGPNKGKPSAPKGKVVTPGGTKVSKPNILSGTAKNASGTPKEKLLQGTTTTKPGIAHEKPDVGAGNAKDMSTLALAIAREKPVAKGKASVGSGNAAKEKSSGMPNLVKEKATVVSSTPAKEKPTLTPIKAKDKSTPATPKEKVTATPSITKRKSVVSQKAVKGTPDDKSKSTPESAVKEKHVGTPSQGKEKPVLALVKDKPVTPGIAKEKSATGQAKTVGATKTKEISDDKGKEKPGVHFASDQDNRTSKNRKRRKLTKVEKDLKSKIRRIAVDIIQPNSEGIDVDVSSGSSSADEMNNDASHSNGSSDEEERRANVPDNREFESFHKTLKINCVLPESWSLGAVLWDPNKKMKVIPASEVDISSTGSVLLKRSVQIYETMQTKVTVDGFDLTDRYDVKTVAGHQDVTRLVLRVARSKICCGIKSISAEDAMYFPDAIPRGSTFYSEGCPIIISKQSMGPLCNNCHKLRNAIRRRKSEQKRAVEMRKAKRSSLRTVNSPFGKALYTLLSDLMADENDPKRRKRRHTLYSRGHNVCLKKGNEGEAGEKNSSERTTNSASISYIMQDIVSKMSLGKMSQEQQPQFFKTEDDQMGMQILNGTLDSNSGNLVVQNAADFTLAEGQEYELIGEVDPNDVQMVEMIKERPNSPQIEIIEVDDHTLAQLTAQNMSGMFLQESGQIHVNMQEMDMNNPAMGQLLKVIGPSHGF